LWSKKLKKTEPTTWYLFPWNEFLAINGRNSTFWHGANCISKRRIYTIYFHQKVIFHIFTFFPIFACISLSRIDDMVPFYTDAHIYMTRKSVEKLSVLALVRYFFYCFNFNFYLAINLTFTLHTLKKIYVLSWSRRK